MRTAIRPTRASAASGPSARRCRRASARASRALAPRGSGRSSRRPSRPLRSQRATGAFRCRCRRTAAGRRARTGRGRGRARRRPTGIRASRRSPQRAARSVRERAAARGRVSRAAPRTTGRTPRPQVYGRGRATIGAVVGCRVLVTLVCVAALAVGGARADAARPKAPQTTWDPSPVANYEPAHRKPGDIHYIVIHVTDGSYAGAVSWLTDAQAHVSSHYVVSREGDISQLVARRDIAWHSGNRTMNADSIGIEHEGMTDDPAGFTDAEYRASAHLVAWLVHVYGIPIDRAHILGHSDVPDPTDPSQGGGIDHHTDPGQYWNWTSYLRLV